MTLNLVPEIKKKYPTHKIYYFCSKGIGDSLYDLMLLAGVDKCLDHTTLDASKYSKTFNLIGYPLHENYPHVPMKRHLLEYFSDELGITPAIYSLNLKLTSPITRDYVTIHAKAGWSNYKEWPILKWEQLISQYPDIPFIQLGAADDPKINGAVHDYMGSPLMTSIKLIAGAKVHLGIDSFSNHVTNMTKTPSIILWGSTQASAAGYSHNINISKNLSCQPCFKEDPTISLHPLGPCNNPPNQTYNNPCHTCMFDISVDDVTSHLDILLSKN